MFHTTKTSAIFCALLVIVFASACGQNKADKLASELSSVKLSKVSDSIYYALGYSMQKDLTNFGKTVNLDLEKNADLFIKGIVEGLKKQTNVFNEENVNGFLSNQIQNLKAKMSEKALQEGKDFLAKNKTQAGVKELPNGKGIQYIVLKSGKGISPTKDDTVTCHYVGTLTDGKEFDNSIKRGQPATFPLGGVIQGWQLALSQMKEGDKWKIFIPSELGYGAQGAGGSIPPNATLVFEVELLKVGKKK